jgi:hypothetical protein
MLRGPLAKIVAPDKNLLEAGVKALAKREIGAVQATHCDAAGAHRSTDANRREGKTGCATRTTLNL